MLKPDDLTFWGKGQPSPDSTAAFHPIAYHLLDVAAVAEQLLLVRPLVGSRAGKLLGMPADDARILLVALVALHDLGKFAPAFQAKVPSLWPARILGSFDPAAAVARAHTEDGYALWDDVLAARLSERLLPGGGELLEALAPAIFGHHGRPVGSNSWSQPALQRFTTPALDSALRCADAVVDLLCARPITARPASGNRARLASWWVAGLITIADWVGSNARWFPYASARVGDLTLASYWGDVQEQAERAAHEAGLFAPTSAPVMSFGELTALDLPPTPVQEWAASVPLPDGPLLTVIEDVTGSGKTEAAQMLVHRLMAAGRASGAYWAMPTMATANAMYERQAKALARLFTVDASSTPSLALVHGRQRLHDGFRSSVLGSAGDGESPTESAAMEATELPSSVACAAFIADDRRAALLADIGAGTVDQALLGVLPSRFNTLRLFGLADKVLVVDEAHAYDAYMGVEVQELLRFQAALGGCAIVLSATLSRLQRESLVQAWADGTAGGGRISLLGAPEERVALRSMEYPLTTLVSRGGAVQECPMGTASWSNRSVDVRLVHDLESAVDHVVTMAHVGGAVAWIRNTVDDCLAAASRLQEHGVDVIVFHARFAHGDRQEREAEVLDRFGKDAPAQARRGRVIVATQVLEQSLDLDFDAMVSDIAPIDLLIQRAGRLQRHPERNAERPPHLPCELVVLSPEPTDAPPTGWLSGVFEGTAHVYEDAGVLWRTVRTLSTCKVIQTPGGLRNLIEHVYDSSEVPDSLLPVAQRVEGQESANAAAATYATLKPTDGYHAGAQAWLSDLRVPTRLGQEQTTVRLARVAPDGVLLPWVQADGSAWRSWALSEVRVSIRKVPPGSVPDAHHERAIAAARAAWGRFEQAIPILPLAQAALDTWTGRLLRSDSNSITTAEYHHATGLSFRE